MSPLTLKSSRTPSSKRAFCSRDSSAIPAVVFLPGDKKEIEGGAYSSDLRKDVSSKNGSTGWELLFRPLRCWSVKRSTGASCSTSYLIVGPLRVLVGAPRMASLFGPFQAESSCSSNSRLSRDERPASVLAEKPIILLANAPVAASNPPKNGPELPGADAFPYPWKPVRSSWAHRADSESKSPD